MGKRIEWRRDGKSVGALTCYIRIYCGDRKVGQLECTRDSDYEMDTWDEWEKQMSRLEVDADAIIMAMNK